MRVSILIPWRTDNGQRQKLWNHCRRLWEATGYEINVGEDPGHHPFNAARAFNRAARKATGDVYITYGADHLPDVDRITWAVDQLHTYNWCAVYAQTAHLSETDTNALLTGYSPTNITPAQVVPFCLGVNAVRADKWIDLDERFTGWGSEDTAWRLVLEATYGPTPQPTGTLWALHHDPAPRDHAEDNYELLREYQNAHNAGTLTDYMAAR